MYLLVNDPQIDYSGFDSGNPIDVTAADRDETPFLALLIAGRVYKASERVDFPDTVKNRHYSNQSAYFVDNCCPFQG